MARGLTFGDEIAFALAREPPLLVIGRFIALEGEADGGALCVLCGPPTGPTRFQVRTSTSADAEASVQLYKVNDQHVMRLAEAPTGTVETALRFEVEPHLRTVAGRYFGEEQAASTEEAVAVPRRPSQRTAAAAAAAPGGQQFDWRGLSGSAQMWQQQEFYDDAPQGLQAYREADDSDSDLIEEPQAAPSRGLFRLVPEAAIGPGPSRRQARAQPPATSSGGLGWAAEGRPPSGRAPPTAPGLHASQAGSPQVWRGPAMAPAPNGYPAAAADPAQMMGYGRGTAPPAYPGPMGYGGPPGPPASGPDVQQLINLEMLRTLKKLQRHTDTGSDSDSDDKGQKGKDFAGIMRGRKRFQKRPLPIVQGYIDRVIGDLGVTSTQQHWELKEFSTKISPQFGRMKGLWRTHHAVSELVQFLVQGDVQHATAFGVLLLQAIHQTALDGGSWDNAIHILPTADPLGRPCFGADETTLLEVHRYRKALKELRGQQPQRKEGEDGEEQQDGGTGRQRRPPKK